MSLSTRLSLVKLRRLAILASSLSVVFLLAFLFYPTLIPASTNATAGIASNPTLEIAPTNTVSFSVTPGTFNSASQTLSVSTNNYTGYQLILSADSSADLVGTNSTIPTITLPNGSSSISASSFTNEYGYSLNAADYKPVLTSEGSTLDTTDEPNTTANTYTLTFGAKVDQSIPAGSYTKSFTISAIANAVGYIINYNKNAEDTVSGMPSPNPQQETISGLSVNLSNATPTRAGYTFLGWDESSSATTPTYQAGDTLTLDPETANSKTLYAIWGCGGICYYGNGDDGTGTMPGQSVDPNSTVSLLAPNFSRSNYGFAGWSTNPNAEPGDGTSTIYGPNANVTVPASGILQLYAIWVQSAGILQGWDGCSELNIGDVTALTDSRDSQVYTVAKLADGKCYMTENLRLDFSDENTTISLLNTNHPTAEFIEEANSHPGPMNGLSYISNTIGYINERTKHNLSPSYNSSNGSWYSYGAYYSLTTFSAYNVTRDTSSTSSGIYDGDICPAGWQINSGGSLASTIAATFSGHHSNNGIYDSSNSIPTGVELSTLIRDYPNNFVRSGYYYYSSYRFYGDYMNSMGFYPVNSYANAGSDMKHFRGMFFDYNGNFYPGRSWTLEVAEGRSAWPIRCSVGSSTTYTLNYDANGGNNAPSASTTTNTTGIFDAITTEEPERSGYTFVNWMDIDGNEVQPGGSYNAGVDNTSTTLYAIWSNNSCNNNATTIGTETSTDAVCLQDVNSTVKNYMASANANAGSIQTYSLIDARDNKPYTVALLDDGNVWMTKNIALGGSSPIFLSPYDTDLSNRSFLFPASSLNSGMYTGENYDGLYNQVYYGGYYYKNYRLISDALSENEYSTSLCPSGWNLPTSEQYATLISDASLTDYTAASSAPYSFTYGGYLQSGYVSEQNSRGILWTSRGVKYDLSSSGFTTQSYNSTDSKAASIRCVLKSGTTTIHYDGNGNSDYPTTGSMPDQIIDIDSGTASINNFVRTGYSFKSWNTLADGTGTEINSNGSIYPLHLANGSEITLYAQWKPQLTIIYNDNYSDTTSSSTPTGAGDRIYLKNYNYFTTRTGYSIKEWNTEPDGSGTTYAVNSSYLVPADLSNPTEIVLYAIWIQDYTITFVNTATEESQIKYIPVGRYGNITPETPWTNSGYKLSGWDTVSNAGVGGSVIIKDNQGITPTESAEITLYTVWNIPYTVVYDGNNADAGTMASNSHNDIAEWDSFDLIASNYSRTNYGFAGWSFTQLDPTNSNFNSNLEDLIENKGIYGPNETIDVDSNFVSNHDSNNQITLYAVWIPVDTTTTFQSFSSSAYEAANPGKTITVLKDTRDDNVYTIAKLADGNWWMTENLRLSLVDMNTGFTAGNTNNPASSYINLNPANLTTPYFQTCTSSNAGCTDRNSFGIGNITLTNTADSSANNQSSLWYSYGVMYNWRTANAGYGNYYMSYGATNGDICPYGWHLPYGNNGTGAKGGNTSGGFYYLGTKLNATANNSTSSKIWRSFPNNYIYSGVYTGASANGRGTNGAYWSSMAKANDYIYAHVLSFGKDSVNPGTTQGYKYSGEAVRCVANSASVNPDNSPSSPSNSSEPAQTNTEPVEQQSSIPEPAQTNNEPEESGKGEQSMSSPKSSSTRSINTESTNEETEEEPEETKDETKELESQTQKTTPLGVTESEEVNDEIATKSNNNNNNTTALAFAGVAATGAAIVAVALTRKEEN